MSGCNGSKYLWYVVGSADDSVSYSQCNEWNPTKRDDPLGKENRANLRITEEKRRVCLSLKKFMYYKCTHYSVHMHLSSLRVKGPN